MGELFSELLGLVPGGEAGELATDGLDLRCAVEPQYVPQGGGVSLLEPLGTLDAPQRHEQKHEEGRAEAIESRADVAVQLGRDPEDTALDQRRQRQQHPRAGDTFGVGEHRRRVAEPSETRYCSVDDAIMRISVEAS